MGKAAAGWKRPEKEASFSTTRVKRALAGLEAAAAAAAAGCTMEEDNNSQQQDGQWQG
jgi:hypothetical protein